MKSATPVLAVVDARTLGAEFGVFGRVRVTRVLLLEYVYSGEWSRATSDFGGEVALYGISEVREGSLGACRGRWRSLWGEIGPVGDRHWGRPDNAVRSTAAMLSSSSAAFRGWLRFGRRQKIAALRVMARNTLR